MSHTPMMSCLVILVKNLIHSIVDGGNTMAERIKDMEKAIREFRANRLATMQGDTKGYISTLDSTFRKAVNTLIVEQLQRQSDDDKRKIKHFFLCRLHTSNYTSSYGALIGLSDSGMYLDAKLSQTDWYPVPLYASLEKDMEEVTKILRRTFIRLQESELFAIKQKLSDDIWTVVESCFCTLVQNNFNLILNSKLRLEDEIQIQCGDYMDHLKIVDTRKATDPLFI